jgi:hypothetical protein
MADRRLADAADGGVEAGAVAAGGEDATVAGLDHAVVDHADGFLHGTEYALWAAAVVDLVFQGLFIGLFGQRGGFFRGHDMHLTLENAYI